MTLASVHLMKVGSRERIIMSDSELMKKLLDGTLDPVELESNPHLYVLAERIYGREALEEMGIYGPKIDSYSKIENNSSDGGDVEIPDFVPDLSSMVKGEGNDISKKKRIVPLFVGIIGFMTVIMNIFLGMGEILCSMGLANWRKICVEGNTQVMWLKGWNWEGLHNIETWKEPGTIEIFDIAMITIFTIMIIIGLFFKKTNTS